jgi:hypothetical protein
MRIVAAAACWSACSHSSSLGSDHLALSPLQLMQHSLMIPVRSMACISPIFTRRVAAWTSWSAAEGLTMEL